MLVISNNLNNKKSFDLKNHYIVVMLYKVKI